MLDKLGGIKWGLLSIVVIVLDLTSKAYFTSTMDLYQSVAVIEDFFKLNFSLTLVHNYGAAFSFLADQGGWQRWFFTLFSALISLALIVWLFRLKASDRLLAIAISLVLGGAIGNLWDRVTMGYVVDFLDVFIQTSTIEWHWPAFNVADSAISIGAVLLIADALLNKTDA
ncbi:MAG: signal peptidase II [Pseudomonadota bacterium]